MEGWLAVKRARLARAHLPASVRDGRILDIGCAASGWFLQTVTAKEKEGVDQVCRPHDAVAPHDQSALRLQSLDIGTQPLPFAEGWFDAVVMLAVIEHVSRAQAVSIAREAHRVLKPGGRYILTTPVRGTEWLLHGLSRVGCISQEELKEHHVHFSPQELRASLQAGGFAEQDIRQGRFELGLNLWAVATKRA